MIAGAEVSEGEKPGFFTSLFGTVAERGVRENCEVCVCVCVGGMCVCVK